MDRAARIAGGLVGDALGVPYEFHDVGLPGLDGYEVPRPLVKPLDPDTILALVAS